MNRNDDIRNIMKLVESAPNVMIHEADLNQLASFVDKIITAIKKEIDADPTSGYAVVEYQTDVMPQELLAYDDPLWDELIAAGWPKNPKGEFKFLNNAFKEKYGLGLYAYADKAENEAHDADEQSIRPEDSAIYKLMGQKMTVKVSPKWAAENLTFYVSGQKLVVVERDSSNLPAAVFGKPSLTALGLSKEDLAEWLIDHGIKQSKRPKAIKRTPPMYD